ncbi:MAG: PD-(D/E)XK nuclease family protein [Dehalococcoidia bacterium]|jgi:hypothetical protein
MTEIKRLSYSMVRAYLDCPQFFYYRYIRKYPAVLEGNMLAGRVYHHGVSYGLKRRKAGELVSLAEVKDLMSDRWESETREKVYYENLEEPQIEARQVNWGEYDPGKLKDTVLKLGALYVRTMVPNLQPIAVEERIEGVVGGVPFVGYPDLIVPGPGVIDHKLATRKATQEFINKDMQFTSYAALLRKPIWGAWHQALNQKKLKINPVTTTRSQGDIAWFSHLVTKVWRGINTGIFVPNPLCWRCGPKCVYEMECRILMED